MGSSTPSMTWNTNQIEIAQCLSVSYKFMPALSLTSKTITCIVKVFILVKDLKWIVKSWNITDHNDTGPLHSSYYLYPLSPTLRDFYPLSCSRQFFHDPSSWDWHMVAPYRPSVMCPAIDTERYYCLLGALKAVAVNTSPCSINLLVWLLVFVQKPECTRTPYVHVTIAMCRFTY